MDILAEVTPTSEPFTLMGVVIYGIAWMGGLAMMPCSMGSAILMEALAAIWPGVGLGRALRYRLFYSENEFMRTVIPFVLMMGLVFGLWYKITGGKKGLEKRLEFSEDDEFPSTGLGLSESPLMKDVRARQIVSASLMGGLFFAVLILFTCNFGLTNGALTDCLPLIAGAGLGWVIAGESAEEVVLRAKAELTKTQTTLSQSSHIQSLGSAQLTGSAAHVLAAHSSSSGNISGFSIDQDQLKELPVNPKFTRQASIEMSENIGNTKSTKLMTSVDVHETDVNSGASATISSTNSSGRERMNIYFEALANFVGAFYAVTGAMYFFRPSHETLLSVFSASMIFTNDQICLYTDAAVVGLLAWSLLALLGAILLKYDTYRVMVDWVQEKTGVAPRRPTPRAGSVRSSASSTAAQERSGDILVVAGRIVDDRAPKNVPQAEIAQP